MSQAPAIVQTPREQWLARRKELVTASDVPAILGFDLRRKPSDVYLAKLGLAQQEETEPMKWGRRLESAVAEGYADATGRPVRELLPYEIAIHPDLPWLGATLDRETQLVPDGAWSPLELKAGQQVSRWEDEEEPPVDFQIQLQIQIEVRRVPAGSLAGFQSTWRPPVWADLERNAEFLAVAIPRLEEFHQLVQRRELPSDADWYSQDAVRRLWRVDNGQAIALTHEDLALVGSWEVATLRRKDAQAAEDDIEKRLAIRMGDAQIGYLPDGSSYVLKRSVVDAQLCECGRVIRKEHVRCTPRRWWPKALRGRGGSR